MCLHYPSTPCLTTPIWRHSPSPLVQMTEKWSSRRNRATVSSTQTSCASATAFVPMPCPHTVVVCLCCALTSLLCVPIHNQAQPVVAVASAPLPADDNRCWEEINHGVCSYQHREHQPCKYDHIGRVWRGVSFRPLSLLHHHRRHNAYPSLSHSLVPTQVTAGEGAVAVAAVARSRCPSRWVASSR